MNTRLRGLPNSVLLFSLWCAINVKIWVTKKTSLAYIFPYLRKMIEQEKKMPMVAIPQTQLSKKYITIPSNT